MKAQLLRLTRWFRPAPFGPLARACGLLGISSASFVMAVLLAVLVDDLNAFLVQNAVDASVRTVLLIAPATIGIVVLIGTLSIVLLKGEGALARAQSVARLLSPLVLSWCVPVLGCATAWKDRPLFFLLLLAGFALVLERTLRFSLQELPSGLTSRLKAISHFLDRPRGRAVALGVVALSSAAYAAYFSYQTILEHHRLTTGTLDLGIGDNLMANLLAGKFFRVPALLPDGSSMLKGHALFGAFLYLPFYAIRPCSETLLIIQATMMGLAAIPLYLFCATQVSRLCAVTLAFCYLLSPIVHGPNFYDFHFISTTPVFHFCLYLGIARKNPWIFGLSWLVLILMREDLSMALIPLGLVLALSGVRVGYGLFLAIASLVAFVIIKFVIMPAAGTWFFSDHYAGLYVPGERSYGSAIVTIATNPALLLTTLFTEAKLIFALHIFAPLLFLTWRNGWLFAATLGAFPSTFMVTNGPYITDIGFQYVTHWVPYVFGGAAVALVLIGKTSARWQYQAAAIGAVGVAVLLHSWVFGAALQRATFSAAAKPIPLRMTAAERKDYQGLVKLRKMIPRDAVVAATPHMYPHVSNWVNAYDLENAHGGAEYLLVSPRSIKKGYRTLRPLLQNVPYDLMAKSGTIYLFRKGDFSPEGRKAWAELGIKVHGPQRAKPKSGHPKTGRNSKPPPAPP